MNCCPCCGGTQYEYQIEVVADAVEWGASESEIIQALRNKEVVLRAIRCVQCMLMLWYKGGPDFGTGWWESVKLYKWKEGRHVHVEDSVRSDSAAATRYQRAKLKGEDARLAAALAKLSEEQQAEVLNVTKQPVQPLNDQPKEEEETTTSE